MNWNNDPAIQLALQEARVRRGLWINTIIWMPFFLLGLGLFIFFFVDVVFDLDKGGTVFLLFVLGTLTTLFGFQGMQSVIDLMSKPRELSGCDHAQLGALRLLRDQKPLHSHREEHLSRGQTAPRRRGCGRLREGHLLPAFGGRRID